MDDMSVTHMDAPKMENERLSDKELTHLKVNGSYMQVQSDEYKNKGADRTSQTANAHVK